MRIYKEWSWPVLFQDYPHYDHRRHLSFPQHHALSWSFLFTTMSITAFKFAFTFTSTLCYTSSMATFTLAEQQHAINPFPQTFNNSIEGFHGNMYCKQSYYSPPNPSQSFPPPPYSRLPIWWILSWWISTTRTFVTVDTMLAVMWPRALLGLDFLSRYYIHCRRLSCLIFKFGLFSLPPLMLQYIYIYVVLQLESKYYYYYYDPIIGQFGFVGPC